MWCCKTTEDQCIPDTAKDNVYVCNGTALSLSEQCHDENYDGPSCNYYPWDSYRYPRLDAVSRSFLDLCKDNRYDKS